MLGVSRPLHVVCNFQVVIDGVTGSGQTEPVSAPGGLLAPFLAPFLNTGSWILGCSAQVPGRLVLISVWNEEFLTGLTPLQFCWCDMSLRHYQHLLAGSRRSDLAIL